MKETTEYLDLQLRCGAFESKDGSLCWRVWAPQVGVVELLLHDDRAKPVAVPMQPERGGYFVHEEPDLREGQRYAFRLDGGVPRPDPCSRWQPDGVHRPSAVLCPERFEWSEGKWSGVRREDLVIVRIQTHDQVGNRARGDRFGTLLEPAQQRLAAGLLLLAPHVPLLFMDEEYGETRPFPFFCSFEDSQLIEAVRAGRRQEFASFAWRGEIPDPQDERTFASATLTWSWPDGSHHAGLRRLYRDLLAARRTWPALRDFRNRTAELLPNTGPPGVLRLTRGGAEGTNTLVAFFNLGGSEQPIPTNHPYGYNILLSSESSDYGGARTAEDSRPVLLPFEFRVYGPITWKSL